MAVRALAIILVLVLGAGSRSAAGEPPELVLKRGSLSLRRLPAVLAESRTARHLETGLTTGFVFTVDAGRIEDRPVKGEAQVRIRYDLWDERFVIERWDGRSDSPAGAKLTRAELAPWWRALTLVLHPARTDLRAAPVRAKVELLVLPFSQAEQRDAQDWLLRSFRSSGPSGAEPAGAGQATSAGPLRAFYGAILAASIGQRSLITYSWTVAVTVESP
jgi:hypothetical protein